MSCTAATYWGVTALDRRIFAVIHCRRAAWRGLAVGLGATAGVAVMAGSATVAAAWLIGLCMGSNPNLRVRTPTALEAAALVGPNGRLAAAANVSAAVFASADSAGLDRFAHSPAGAGAKGARLPSPYFPGHAGEASETVVAAAPSLARGARQVASEQTAQRETGGPPPSARRGDRLDIRAPGKIAGSPAERPSPRLAAVGPAGLFSPSFNLFDPDLIFTGALPSTPASAPLDSPPPPDGSSERANEAPARLPLLHDRPQMPAPREIAGPPSKPALPQVATIIPAPLKSTPSNSLPQRPASQLTLGASLSLAAADSRTAIYDIAAHTVYLPNGERLEAHSGLGQRLDDPHYVYEKARGPTPPNVYGLALRDGLFHGVRAIRLNPVDDRKMFGRDGILAHTYMLGPTGQSFGCVSFKNYPQFLKAFLRGEIDRLVVVPHLEGKPLDGERAHRAGADLYAFNNRSSPRLTASSE